MKLGHIVKSSSISTHYYNSNLIWCTVSQRVDVVIPSDHPNAISYHELLPFVEKKKNSMMYM